MYIIYNREMKSWIKKYAYMASDAGLIKGKELAIT
jgi:hypothetical protein